MREISIAHTQNKYISDYLVFDAIWLLPKYMKPM